MPMPMKPIVSRELGLVSAAQMCDGRRKGVTAAEAAARLRNERRENCMVNLSLKTCWQEWPPTPAKPRPLWGEKTLFWSDRKGKVKYGTSRHVGYALA